MNCRTMDDAVRTLRDMVKGVGKCGGTNVSVRKLQQKNIILDSSSGDRRNIEGYKIIESNILISMLNTCSKCTNCGSRKQHICPGIWKD